MGSLNNSKVEGTFPYAMLLLQRCRKTRKKEKEEENKRKEEREKEKSISGKRNLLYFHWFKTKAQLFVYICLANEQLYAYKFNKLDEMDKFLKK